MPHKDNVLRLFPKGKPSESNNNDSNDYKVWLRKIDVLSGLLISELLNYRGKVRSYLEETSSGELRPLYNNAISSHYDQKHKVITMTLLLNSGNHEIAIVPIKQIIFIKVFGYITQGAHRRNGILYPVLDDFPELNWKTIEEKATHK